MNSIELLAEKICSLEACSGTDRNAYTVFAERIHIARGPEASLEFFIEGSLESFGVSVVGQSLEWGTFRDIGAGRTFEALVLRAKAGSGSVRLMAHLAYEAFVLLEERPALSNADLLRALSPFVSIILERTLLSPRMQMGLTAELMLMVELLNFCEQQASRIDEQVCLDVWHGWESASRDFSAAGVAIEVKATSRDTRRHAVHPMYQLLSDQNNPGEQVYAFSVGLVPDASQSFRLLTMVDRVQSRLGDAARSRFEVLLSRYGGAGYQTDLRSYYQLESGFLATHSPTLFRVDHLRDILRPASFTEGTPPARAFSIRYDVSLDGLPSCSRSEREEVFARLLGL